MARRQKRITSNEELCVLAKQGNGYALEQLCENNRAHIVDLMKEIGFRYHPYWNEMIEWGEIGIIQSVQEYDPSRGTTFLTFATYKIRQELRNFLKSIRMAYMENYYPDDEESDYGWAGDVLFTLACRELRPLEKQVLNERRDLLLDAGMESLPEQERKYIEYHYGFVTGKPMSRAAVAEILGVPEAEAERIETDALDYLRGCFHMDKVNAFYEVCPESEAQQRLALNAVEALWDDLAGNHVDNLLAQFEEDWDDME